MVYNGKDPITSLMVGQMGIKTAKVGSTTIYNRPGSYVYIKLEKSKDKGD